MDSLRSALIQDVDPSQILSLLESLDLPEEDWILVIRDTYAYALNSYDQELQRMLLQRYPQILNLNTSEDLDFLEDVYVYGRIYGREDLQKVAIPDIPWGKLLLVAVVEDIDPIIQATLDDGIFTEMELSRALVGAYRLGNQEIQDYLGALVGPNADFFIRRGYADQPLRDAMVPYRSGLFDNRW